MVNIKIKRTDTDTDGGYTTETSVEISDPHYTSDELVKFVIDKIGRDEPDGGPSNGPAEQGDTKDKDPETGKESPDRGKLCTIRRIRSGYISPENLKAAILEGRLDEVVSPYDEINIPLDIGGKVTVVCGYSDPHTARFVFKNCFDEGVMNDEATNKGGYYKSKGREHVLADILPHIAQEWRKLMKPRKMVEEIDGERVEYEDLMWLLSATDVCDKSKYGFWKELGDDFKLPIFNEDKELIHSWENGEKCSYWLRSVDFGDSGAFFHVDAYGAMYSDDAKYQHGFVSGFDIGTKATISDANTAKG